MYVEYFILAYLILFFLSIISLVIRVKRQSGVFPIVSGTGSHGFVGRLLLVSYLLLILNAISFISAYAPHPIFYSISLFDYQYIQTAGLIVIGVSLLLMYISQIQMGTSWRIGIGSKKGINLVSNGLFQYLRHPIYFFAILVGLGVFLVIPTIASAIVFLFLYIMLSIQARMEEDFMLETFGEKYRIFMQNTRRFF